ncbi:MAG: TonB-dependent receptor [Ignavibacteriales bacterium]|nr:TonB-dependent receptor [Ignavibacteriales bacterium]
MKKFLIAIILISSIANFAQNSSLKGKIISDKNELLEGVNILVSGTQFGAASFRDGSFEIRNLPFGVYTLEVSMIGYAKKKFTVDFNSDYKPITIVLIEEAIQTDQIIVSAGKYEQRVQDLAVSTTILSPDFISRNNFITFDDMLRNVPGVQLNLEQPSIRGSSGYSKGTGARVLVAVNGIPMYSGDTGDITWELIPTADIERIEIIKGPASSLYGSSAIGGVINIITKSSVKNPITHFSTYFGVYDNPAYDFWKWNNSMCNFYGVELTHSGSVDKLGYTFSFKKFDNMSYRQSDYAKRYLGYIKLNYDFNSENHLTFFADYLNMMRGNFLYWKDSRNALVPKDEDNGNTVESNRLFTGLIYHHSFNKKIFAELKSSYYYTKFDGRGIELTTSTANLFRNELLANMILSNEFILTSGVEASYSKIISNIFKNPNFFGAGVFSQLEYKGITNLIATIGLRYDYMKMDSVNNANAITPKIGLNYKLTNDFILRGSLGTGFRAPTPSEVFTTAAVGGGFNIKGNTDLTAETSLSFEIGCNYQPYKTFSIDLSLYQTNYKNYIEANLTKNAEIQFINLPEARIQGLEIGSNFYLIPDLVSINLGYNFMNAKNLADDKYLKYRPRHTFNAQVRFTPNPFDFGINFRYASRVDEIDDLITQPPISLVVDGDKRVPIYVTDISIGYNFLFNTVPAKIYLNAKNIFNYNYVEFIGNIAPIRNYSLSFELFF